MDQPYYLKEPIRDGGDDGMRSHEDEDKER